MTLKEIYLGGSSFVTIMDDNYLYADKTKYIYDLLSQGPFRSVFLSRPRRFGKTLLIGTLRELFTGNRDRFKDLWIGQSDYTFPRHPVIHLSLSIRAPNPDLLEKGLLAKLRDVAQDYGLHVNGDTPNLYFSRLIKALKASENSKVVVLIDEYDAPVTRNMDNKEIAKANASVLHDFFAILKDSDVTDCLRFTLITGITRYALTSMDSGPNELFDISLVPRYAGICGFTIEEFNTLFADRMEATLAGLKEAGEMPSSASVLNLREDIFHWYDGYNWGGQTRVLNPFSILKFFILKSFDQYWILSGRPNHLTAMMMANPFDFMDIKLKSYLSANLMKTDLINLEAIPVLFHSGYLTVDNINITSVYDADTKKSAIEKRYTFKLPNHEVASSYMSDFFCATLGLKSRDDLSALGKELRQAFLERNAQTIGDIFNMVLSSKTYHQKINNENDFHNIVRTLFQGMGLKVLSEVPGAVGRLDMAIELSDNIYVIIELKFCPKPKGLTEDEKNDVLARLALTNLPRNETDEVLSFKVQEKIGVKGIRRILSDHPRELSNQEMDSLFAKQAEELLAPAEMDFALASLARKKFDKKVIKKSLSKSTGNLKPTQKLIEAKLSGAVQEALKQIVEKDYHGPFKLHAKEFIDLGLAIYGDGLTIKAAFGPR